MSYFWNSFERTVSRNELFGLKLGTFEADLGKILDVE